MMSSSAYSMPIRIPFNNLRLAQQSCRSHLQKAFREVLDGGTYILGSEVKSFEKAFARYAEVSYCAGVGSGTDALTLALRALGVGQGDEVITSALTAYPTITGILQSGATPVLADVFPEDGLLNVEFVKKVITKKTRVIIPVHLFGQSCDMKPLMRLARENNLKVVEDCAQSAGALYQGRPTGSFGDCGAFSFYPTKNLGALGDAGAVTTRHFTVYRKITRLRDYGRNPKNLFEENGINSRLDELQASLLRVKLSSLEKQITRRRYLARLYRELLPAKVLLNEHKDRKHTYHLFVVKVPNRNRLIRSLAAQGIETRVHYARPVCSEKAYPGRMRVRGNFPAASQLCRQFLSLPFFPEMTEAQVRFVVKNVRGTLEL